jgi:hypothetical protein
MLDTFCRFISRDGQAGKLPNQTKLHIKDWLDTDSYKAAFAARQLR